MHDDGHETGPRTHSVDAPRETGKTVSLGPGKGDIVLVCDVQRIGLRHTTTRIIINRSSATAEKQWKQCISYASLSRLANWGQNYYIISGLGGTCPLCLPPSMDPSLPGDGHISVWYTCIYVWYICVTVSGTHVSVWYTCDSVWYTCVCYTCVCLVHLCIIPVISVYQTLPGDGHISAVRRGPQVRRPAVHPSAVQCRWSPTTVSSRRHGRHAQGLLWAGMSLLFNLVNI